MNGRCRHLLFPSLLSYFRSKIMDLGGILIGLILLINRPFAIECAPTTEAKTNSTNIVVQPMPLVKINDKNPGSNEDTKSQVNNEHKREIGLPDALVDDPEEFDESVESNSEELPFALPAVTAKEARLLPSPRLSDDTKDYPYYSTEERRKRTPSIVLGRSKREMEIDPRFLKLVELLRRGPYLNPPVRTNDQWGFYEPRTYDVDYNQNNELEDFEPLDFLPEPSENRLFPVSKLRLPVYRRNIL